MSDVEYEQTRPNEGRDGGDAAHGTPESWLAGCRCRDCEKAQPDANVQAAYRQGVENPTDDEKVQEDTAAAVEQADGQTGGGVRERAGQAYADPGERSTPGIDYNPGGSTGTSAGDSAYVTPGLGDPLGGPPEGDRGGTGYEQTTAERDVLIAPPGDDEPGDTTKREPGAPTTGT